MAVQTILKDLKPINKLAVICRSVQSRRSTCPDIASVVLESQRFDSVTVSKRFNLMLKAYSDTANFNSALETFNYMTNNRIYINKQTCYSYLIKLIRTEQLLGLGLDVLYKMMEAGVHVSVYTLTVVVDRLCKVGDIKAGRELVKHAMRMSGKVRPSVDKPNVVTFNTLIGACCRRWEFIELDLVLGLMEEGGLGWNVETYKILIDGYLSGGRVGDAERLVIEMCDKGLKVEMYLWNLIVGKYCELGKMESAFQVFDEMSERGVWVCRNDETCRILVSGICWVGEMDAAMELAGKLQRKGVDLGCGVFGDLVKGWCKKGEFGDAVGLLLTMERKGLFGDVGLYEMVVAGLCESGRVDEAMRLLSFVVKCGATTEFITNLVKDPK
ncbi:uncharacterized protein LOC143537191 [Bidens hawaiensis]|uniref:uncharacterized protein LOC143537191 n=1 Tax=Bidens hawaiensis TaxID=980011 RepID=UPI004049C879